MKLHCVVSIFILKVFRSNVLSGSACYLRLIDMVFGATWCLEDL